MAEWKVSEIIEPPKLNINQWAEEDRPREKLARLGATRLSTAELLAILIGSGTPDKSAVELMKDVLHDCDGSLKKLGQMEIEQLTEYKGIGEAKAITILAACELGKRREHEDAEKITRMESASKIFQFMYPKMKDLKVEQSWCLLMNNNFGLIKAKCLSEGGYTETAVDIRVIAREALLCNATVVALIHNHPSGSLRPSHDDDNLTKQVKAGCSTMRLHFADHLIIGHNDYYSYREEGRL